MMRFKNFGHTSSRINVFGHADFISVGKVLYPRSDVHSLPEIVEALVKRYRYRGTLVNPDLKNEITPLLIAVQLLYRFAHLQRRHDCVGRREECRHHSVANGLDNRALVSNCDIHARNAAAPSCRR